MRPRSAVRYLLPFAWTLGPAYGFERLAEYYYLQGNQFFYALSGPRLEVFIASFFFGSVAAAVLLKDFRAAAAVQVVSLLAVLFAVYYACDPRVCYSPGADGLELLRLGVFLGSVAVCGASLGARPLAKWELALTSGSAFFAVAYYPVIFDFAGTKLLQPIHPWGLLAVLFVVAFAISAASLS
jgi:hypothetical protein